MNEIETRLKDLATETDEFKRSEFFRQYLDVMSKFWKYSYHNQMLICCKMPDASRVAGFRTWKELNRNVKKGSKAIKILAPYKKKVTDKDPVTSEEKEKRITLFIPVNVFDISQTEGEDMPDIDITVTGDNYKDFLDNLVNLCNEKKIEVNFENLGVNGLYGYSSGGKIAITDREGINTQVNIIIHEIAHELLHKEKNEFSRQEREIQAEGTAYVVTKHFGMENKSFNYLALYDADYKKIMENLKSVAQASKEIIEFLEKEILRLSGFASNCLRTGHGPGSLKTGLKLNLMNDMKANKHTLQFQLIAGHSSIYLVDNVDKHISPMFKSGLFQAALTSINLTDNFLTSFWISRNQYGLNQTYFGATLTFGWNGKRMGDLLDVLYP